MFGYRCSEVWKHGETLGARHLGGVQCCRGSSESRNPDSLASPVPLMLNFFPWRHHQAATKNCCRLAALQTEVWSGRQKTSCSITRPTLDVKGPCIEVGGCEVSAATCFKHLRGRRWLVPVSERSLDVLLHPATSSQQSAPLSLSSLSSLHNKGVLAGKMVEGK